MKKTALMLGAIAVLLLGLAGIALYFSTRIGANLPPDDPPMQRIAERCQRTGDRGFCCEAGLLTKGVAIERGCVAIIAHLLEALQWLGVVLVFIAGLLSVLALHLWRSPTETAPPSPTPVANGHGQ